ncbi:MAG TPA: hypothetical protein VNM37_15220 [Candidatus Dormibacteraeota bacterium]|nr:hypothetical protein [Candidatus Dormibacteraeota bacterium]
MSTATRGWASMDPAARSAWGRAGALLAKKSGRAYRWDSASAAEAGRNGGYAKGAKLRAAREEQARLELLARCERRKARWAKRRGRAPKVPAPAPAPVLPPPVAPPAASEDPMAQLAARLKQVVRDALGSGKP